MPKNELTVAKGTADYLSALRAYEGATVEDYEKGIAFYRSVVANKDATIKYLLATKQVQKEILKQFADMISPAVTQMPPTTKYQPKMTLAPFIDAYRAVYGDPDKDEA